MVVFAQDTRYYIQTPRGSDVPDTYQTTEMSESDRAGWDNYFATNYPNATQIKLPGEAYSSTRTFNCHGYAWRYVDYSQRLWIGYSQAGSEEIFWNDGSYDQVSEAVSTKISYTGDHSAIPSGTANYYYSKWNRFPLMYHQKDYTPGYGTANQFFRRSVDVPQDQSTIASALSAAVSGQTVNVTGTQSLTGNVSVPSGVTLSINSSATINPSGYSITTSGGTLTVQSGATINGCALLTGGTYNGIYSTMQAALSAASSGQNVGVNNAQTVSSSLTVPSGVALSLNSGVAVTFSSGTRISVYGSLSANGNTFQGNGSAGSWNSLSFYSGSSGSIQSSTIRDAVCGIYTSGANVTLSNSTITNNSSYGISSISSSTINVSSCTISNNGTGINANSVAATITGNTIINNTNYGINATNIADNPTYWYSNSLHGNGYALVLNNAHPWIANNDICDNYHGVVINSSFPNFCVPGGGGGYNAITYSSTPLFKADNASTVVAGYWSQGGYNSVYGSELPDMEARNSSRIWADNTYWGSGQPAIYADGTSWITARTPLASDQTYSSCSGFMAKSTLVTASSAVKGNASSIQSERALIYEEAITNGREGHFQKAKETLLTLIDGEYDHKYSPLALTAFYEVTLHEKQTKNKGGVVDSTNTELNDLLAKVSKRAKGDSLRPYALRFLAREAALAHDTRAMISYNKELVDIYTNSSNELSALYDLTTHYAEIEQDYSKASEFYSRMVKAYPDEDLTKFATINLSNNFGQMKKEVSSKTVQLPNDYYLSDAYPNPFNPTTTITYQIPKEGFVTLTIFDILGNEVRTIVNGQKEAGKYSVQFDASFLASGTYVYQLRVNDYTSTKKMLLLK